MCIRHHNFNNIVISKLTNIAFLSFDTLNFRWSWELIPRNQLAKIRLATLGSIAILAFPIARCFRWPWELITCNLLTKIVFIPLGFSALRCILKKPPQ